MPTPTITKATKPETPSAGRAGLPSPPPKTRRRPIRGLIAAGAVLLGAVLGAVAWTAAASTSEVVAARSTLLRGETIERADLIAVRLGVDPALHPIPAVEIDSLVGQRVALDTAAGGLLTRDSVTPNGLPERGTSVVGLSLAAGLVPSDDLEPGDRVRIVATPGQQGEVEQTPPTIQATVVRVGLSESGGWLVDVQVSELDAAELAARAATGRVALVLDSQER